MKMKSILFLITPLVLSLYFIYVRSVHRGSLADPLLSPSFSLPCIFPLNSQRKTISSPLQATNRIIQKESKHIYSVRKN